MKFSLDRLSAFGFNSRALTEQDFYAICEAENIEVLEMNVSTSFYMKVLDEPIIVLNKRLKGLKRTFAMFHELSHHFLHGGRDAETQAWFLGMTETRNEVEADALALIALIPLEALNNYDFLEENPTRYAKKLFKERQRLNFLYGL